MSLHEFSVIDCPFCEAFLAGSVLGASEFCFVVEDKYPSSPGHRLIVPKRHVADPFDLSEGELLSMFELARSSVVSLRSEDPSVEGFNVGFNVAAVAGQTVEHAHLHVIPRRRCDVADPRGGIRWVIPATAVYWED